MKGRLPIIRIRAIGDFGRPRNPEIDRATGSGSRPEWAKRGRDPNTPGRSGDSACGGANGPGSVVADVHGSVKFIPAAAAVLILARFGADLLLATLNRKEVQRHSDRVPEAFRSTVDDATLCPVCGLHPGPITLRSMERHLGGTGGSYRAPERRPASLMGRPSYLARLRRPGWMRLDLRRRDGVVADRTSLWAWAQFRLEQRFRIQHHHGPDMVPRPREGIPSRPGARTALLLLVLKLVGWMGPGWWLWAWVVFLGFQILMLVLAPVLILPLFNKLTPCRTADSGPACWTSDAGPDSPPRPFW